MSSRRQRSITLGGRYRQVSLYLCCVLNSIITRLFHTVKQIIFNCNKKNNIENQMLYSWSACDWQMIFCSTSPTANFAGPTLAQRGSCRLHVGLTWAQRALLSGVDWFMYFRHFVKYQLAILAYLYTYPQEIHQLECSIQLLACSAWSQSRM